MTARDDFDRHLSAWFAADAASREPEHLLGSVLARTARTRRRPAWLIPERWIPMSAITSRTAAATRVPWRLVLAVALLVVALAVGALLMAGGQQRQLPAPFGPAANGMVAYAADGDIYTVDSVTGQPRAIVTGPESDVDPVWSLDGTRLAFVRTVPGQGEQLYVAHSDGSGITRLTPEAVTGIESVSFSPDGREVLFTSAETGASSISIARADGSGVRTLDLAMVATDPMYRPPDGAEIVFTGMPGSDPRATGVYVVKADGSDLRNLVPAAADAAAGGSRWSPDGSQIAYNLVDFTVQHWTVQTHVMSADGSNDRTLPSPPGAKWNFSAAWSNDGTRLVMQRGYSPAGDEDIVIAVVPADGSGTGLETEHFLIGSQPSGQPYRSAWAPDDTSILVSPDGSFGKPFQSLVLDPLTGETRAAAWASTSMPVWQRVAP